MITTEAKTKPELVPVAVPIAVPVAVPVAVAGVPHAGSGVVPRTRALRPRQLAKDLFGSVVFAAVFIFLLGQIVVLALLDIF